MGRKGSIGRKEKIAVPAKNWKVIAVLYRQGLGMQGVTIDTRTIALEILKLLKLPVMITLGEFWCLEAIGQEYNQFD